jgi:hypothetical protein
VALPAAQHESAKTDKKQNHEHNGGNHELGSREVVTN